MYNFVRVWFKYVQMTAMINPYKTTNAQVKCLFVILFLKALYTIHKQYLLVTVMFIKLFCVVRVKFCSETCPEVDLNFFSTVVHKRKDDITFEESALIG